MESCPLCHRSSSDTSAGRGELASSWDQGPVNGYEEWAQRERALRSLAGRDIQEFFASIFWRHYEKWAQQDRADRAIRDGIRVEVRTIFWRKLGAELAAGLASFVA